MPQTVALRGIAMADNEQHEGSSPDEEDEDFSYIVRVHATDLDGHKPVRLALTDIKGVGDRIAAALADQADLPREERIGDLEDEEVARIEETVQSTDEIVPDWMRNRRKDVRSGADGHLLSSDLDDRHREDLNRLKKIQCYRGVRHQQGRKVRGQRTKSNGRTGLALGVSRAEQQAQAEAEE
jgi:small subunit ribosomal protein S13